MHPHVQRLLAVERTADLKSAGAGRRRARRDGGAGGFGGRVWRAAVTLAVVLVAVLTAAVSASARNLARSGNSAVVSVAGPGEELDFYFQPIGAGGWSKQVVARAGLIVGEPAITQSGNSTVIAAETANHSLLFFYQGIGQSRWTNELVAGAGTTYSSPDIAQVGSSTVIAAEGR
jgi:hypothetical protein